MLLHGYKQSMSESKEALEIGILEGLLGEVGPFKSRVRYSL